MAGRLIAINGIDNLTRLVVTIDNGGNFQANHLVAGTYQVSLMDTTAPGFTAATVPIYEVTTSASVNLTYTPPAVAINKNYLSVISPTIVSGIVKQDGHSFARNLPFIKSTSPVSCDSNLGDVTIYSVSSAAQDATQTCAIDQILPKGTSNVSLKIIVTSAEYPTYTQQKSKYNDTWSYEFSGLPGAPSDGEAVNDTHYTTGTIKKEVCVDVTNLTKNEATHFGSALH